MSEIVYLVDENDNVLGSKERELLDDNDCWRIIRIWLVNDNDEVLLARRSLKKKIKPGLWAESVAGTVEYGDSYEETAHRELEEELGITGLVLEGLKKLHYKDMSFGWRMCQHYRAEYNGDITNLDLQEDEVDKLQWVPLQSAAAFLAEHDGSQLANKDYWQSLLP